jgi:hypothetical protein
MARAVKDSASSLKISSISCPVFAYPPRLKLSIAAAEAPLIYCQINYYNR